MAEDFRIRVARAEDTEAVETVLRASYSVLLESAYPTDILARALPLMVRANPALLSSGTYYLVTMPDGTATGCGGWTLEPPAGVSASTDPTRAHIRHFATHPNWVRRGIGRALFDRCVAEARAIGVERFECHSTLVGESFYRALGFRAVEAVSVDMGAGIILPSIRMICDFDD
jgi:N-acetylglutamate synthase-like GNAT family acetyltransferase